MSQQSIEKIYPRSPRYVLNLKDKKVLRYAPIPRGNRSFFTEIINLSETGMAFTVPYLDTPQKNEIIMVEFTPPNGESQACYAQVKRVENCNMIASDFFQKNCKVVAVQFTNMPEAQKEILRQGIGKEFRKTQGQFKRQQWILKAKWLWKFKRKQCLGGFSILSGLGLVLGALSYWF